MEMAEYDVSAEAWEFCAPAWHDFTRPDDELPSWADDGYFGESECHGRRIDFCSL